MFLFASFSSSTSWIELSSTVLLCNTSVDSCYLFIVLITLQTFQGFYSPILRCGVNFPGCVTSAVLVTDSSRLSNHLSLDMLATINSETTVSVTVNDLIICITPIYVMFCKYKLLESTLLC